MAFIFKGEDEIYTFSLTESELNLLDDPRAVDLLEEFRAKANISASGDEQIKAAVTELRFALRNLPHAKTDQTVDAPSTMESGELDPPKMAEFLLVALSSPSRGQSMVGDLNERFANERDKLGRCRAVRLYWARTLRSLWPLLRRAIGKALKWGAVIAAARRLF